PSASLTSTLTHPDLPSFPTRRSSDLGGAAVSAADASRVVHEADVCVIGAGAGGAVVAAELAEGGARVVLLEQGPSHDIDKFSARDRKSTRLNSSHQIISYAVFCLKKK